jgi:hypothetical protein
MNYIFTNQYYLASLVISARTKKEADAILERIANKGEWKFQVAENEA